VQENSTGSVGNDNVTGNIYESNITMQADSKISKTMLVDNSNNNDTETNLKSNIDNTTISVPEIQENDGKKLQNDS